MERMNSNCRWRKSAKSQYAIMHLLEIKEFRDSRAPMRDSTGFWKFSRLARLKVCAKIIFRIPVSSAVIERLFSEAGMLVTKQRKRMLPKVMKKLVYDPVREKVQKVNGVRSRRRELKRVELTDLTLKCRMKTE